MGRPRIRSIKPEMWQHEKLGRISRDERLLFVGLVTMADDEGRLRDMAHAIRGHCFPYDRVSDRRLESWLSALARERLIVRYGTGRERFVHIRGFTKHQRINRPSSSDLPPPPGSPVAEPQASLLDHGAFSEASSRDLGRDQGSEGKGAPVGSNGHASDAAGGLTLGEEFAQKTADVVAILERAPRFAGKAQLAEYAIASAIENHLEAEPLAAARAAVISSSDPDFRMEPPARVFELKLKEQIREQAAPRSAGSTAAPARVGRKASPSDLLRALDGDVS